jgi:hypothetical protein
MTSVNAVIHTLQEMHEAIKELELLHKAFPERDDINKRLSDLRIKRALYQGDKVLDGSYPAK